MKERPILFSAPMVKAILSGAKTQTRRVIKPQPYWDAEVKHANITGPLAWPIGSLRQQCGTPIFIDGRKDWSNKIRNPYGMVGDRLWVRETHLFRNAGKSVVYRQQYAEACGEAEAAGFAAMYGGWKPSIFMPRWASRITLEITDVRVQRVQDIGEQDAIAEGVEKRGEFPNITPWTNYQAKPGSPGAKHFSTPLRSFNSLWDSINGKKHPWAENCWVWALSFRRVDV